MSEKKVNFNTESRIKFANLYKEKAKKKNKKDKKEKVERLLERLNSHTHLRGISDEIVKSLMNKIQNMTEEPSRTDTIVLDFLHDLI